MRSCIVSETLVVQYCLNLIPRMSQQPLVGQVHLIIEANCSHSDTSHSVGLPWTSDQPDSETST